MEYANIKKILFKERYLILFLLVLFLVRCWGIGLGLPKNDLVADETFSVSYILRVLQSGNPFVHTINPYPVMLSMLHLPFVILNLFYIWGMNGFGSLNALQVELVIGGVVRFLIWTRLVSAFFGTATVFILFRLLSYVFSRRAAWLGSIAVGMGVLAIHLSHWGRAHAVLSFFVLASVYFSVLYTERKEAKYLYACVVSAAGAMATHYLGVSAMIFPLLGVISVRPKRSELLKAIVIFLLIVLPAYSFNYAGVFKMVKDTFTNYYAPNGYVGLYPIGKFERFYYIFSDLFNLDLIGTLLAVLGLAVYGIRKSVPNGPKKILFFGLFFMYLVQISIVAARHETRWILPLYLLGIGSGVAALYQFLGAQFERRSMAVAGIILFCLIPQAVTSVKWLSLIKKHTSLSFIGWMESHRQQRIFLFSDYIYMLPTPEAAAWNADHNPWLKDSMKNSFVIANPDKFETSGVNYFHASGKMDDYCKIIRDLMIDSVVLSYRSKEERADQMKRVEGCISPEPVAVFHPGKIGLLDSPYEDLANTIVSSRYIWESDAVGTWIDVYPIKKQL